MPNSPTTLTAQGWLQTARCPQQRVSEVARAIAMLESTEPMPSTSYAPPFSADLEMALLLEAESRGRIDLVQVLCTEAADKATAKHAKKLLFKAKQRGVVVPERPSARAAVDLSAQPDPLPSYASSFDGGGGQLLFLGGWTPSDGGFCVMATVSDREGLLSAYHLPNTSRTQQRDLLARLKNQFTGFTVEVPAAFAAGRMRWGLDMRDQMALPFEGDVAEVRRLLHDAEPIQAIDLALDPEDEARIEERMADAAPLVQDPCFAAWLTPDAQLVGSLSRLLVEVRRAQDPAVAPDHPGTEAAVAEARSLAVREWLDEQERVRMAERLEITSWLLVVDGRRELAMRAVSTARGLRDPARAVDSIGFIAAAMDRRLPLAHLSEFVAGAGTTLQPLNPARKGR